MTAMIPRPASSASPPLLLLLVAALVFLAPAASARVVPDSTVLARVGSRTVTAGVFADNWVAGNAMSRPALPDSAGRRQFLDVLVHRELMRLGARAAATPLDFAQRAQLAEVRGQALTNALYVSMVKDSVQVSDEEVHHMFTLKSQYLLVRRITVRTEQEAAGIRSRLLRGEPWSEVVKLSVDTFTVRRNGEVGLQGYLHFRPQVAWEVFKVKDGGYSPPLYDRGFWHIFFVEKRHIVKIDPIEKAYRSLSEEVRRIKEPQLMEVYEQRFAKAQNMKYNAENLAFAAREFANRGHVKFTNTGPEIDLDASPEFAPADSSRVLATGPDGAYTLGQFVKDYLALPPLSRPAIQATSDMIHAINRFIFQPYLLRLSQERGMENSAYFKSEMERVEDNMRIERFYADSVERWVRITPQERKRYYEKNKNLFFTYTREHMFIFYRPSAEWAQGLGDSLRKGIVKPGAIARADSLDGRGHWSEERIAWSNGANDLRQMFNEMKDGEVRVVPEEKVSMVVMRVEQIPGHQLTLQEADATIDETLRGQRAEEILQSLLGRLRKKYPVRLYPESLMDLDLTMI